jgi:hypothetical protein
MLFIPLALSAVPVIDKVSFAVEFVAKTTL